MPWDNSFYKDIYDDIFVYMLLTYDVKNNSDGNYTDVNYSLETTLFNRTSAT